MKVLVLLFLIVSCASSIIPKEQRKLSIIEETNNDYEDAMIYIAKSFGDSSKAVKYHNEQKRTIIIKGNTECNIFRQWGDPNKYLLQFTATIRFKVGKVHLLFENLYISSRLGQPVSWGYNQLSDDSKVKKSQECLQSFINGIYQ